MLPLCFMPLAVRHALRLLQEHENLEVPPLPLLKTGQRTCWRRAAAPSASLHALECQFRMHNGSRIVDLI